MIASAATPNPALTAVPGSIDELRAHAADGRLYAVLDACDTPAVPEKARELGERRAVSLYRGSADEMYWAIAPYLFAVDPALLDWIVETLWEEPFGIFAVADADLEEVRRHFRRFLVVHSPEGEQWYFRFYDPRVLGSFLRTCTEDQVDLIFGPVSSFTTHDPGSVHVIVLNRSQLGKIPKIRIRGR